MQITITLPSPSVWDIKKLFGIIASSLLALMLLFSLFSSSPATSANSVRIDLPPPTAGEPTIQFAPMSWIVGPPKLKGGKETSVHQAFAYAKQLGLTFASSGGQRKELVSTGHLVKLESDTYLKLHKVSEPYALPATKTFLHRLAQQYSSVRYETKGGTMKRCGRLVATSALRLTGKQPPNASRHSVHPTGMAVDLRIPTVPQCRAWLEATLLEIEQSGRIDATLEKSPPHYHVVVITKTYEHWLAQRS